MTHSADDLFGTVFAFLSYICKQLSRKSVKKMKCLNSQSEIQDIDGTGPSKYERAWTKYIRGRES